MSDRLDVMFEQQRDFITLLQSERSFPVVPVDITTKCGQRLLEDISFNMMKELFESGQHLRNTKQHRLTQITEVNREAYKEELVDVLHYYFELCIAADISLDELVEAYLKKGEINVSRIKNGY